MTIRFQASIYIGGATSAIANNIFAQITALAGAGQQLPHPADVRGLVSHIRMFSQPNTTSVLNQLQVAVSRFTGAGSNSSGGTTTWQLSQAASWDNNRDGILTTSDVNRTVSDLGSLIRSSQAALNADIASNVRRALVDGGAAVLAAASRNASQPRLMAIELINTLNVSGAVQRVSAAAYGNSSVLEAFARSLLQPESWGTDSNGTITATSINTTLLRLGSSVMSVADNATAELIAGVEELLQRIASAAIRQVVTAPSTTDRLVPVLSPAFQNALTRQGGLLSTLARAVNSPTGVAGADLFTLENLALLSSGDGWDTAGNKDGLVTLADVGALIRNVPGLITNPTARNVLTAVLPSVASPARLTLSGMASIVANVAGTDGLGSFLMDQLGPHLEQLTAGTVGGLVSDSASSWAARCAESAATCLGGLSRLSSSAVGRTTVSVASSVDSLLTSVVGESNWASFGRVLGSAFGPIGRVLSTVLGGTLRLFGHQRSLGAGHLQAAEWPSARAVEPQSSSSLWQLLAQLDDHPRLRVSKQGNGTTNDVWEADRAGYPHRLLAQALNGSSGMSNISAVQTSSERAAMWEQACVAMKRDLDAALTLLRDIQAFTSQLVWGNVTALTNPGTNLYPSKSTAANAMAAPPPAGNGAAGDSNITDDGDDMAALMAYLGPADMSAAAVASRIASAPDMSQFLSELDQQLLNGSGDASQQDIATASGLIRRALKAIQAAAVSSLAVQVQSVANPPIVSNANGSTIQTADTATGRCATVNLASLNTASGDPVQLLSYLSGVLRPHWDAERASRVYSFLQALQTFAVQYRFSTLQPVSYRSLLGGQRASTGQQPSVSDLSAMRSDWQADYNRYLSGMGPATRLGVALEFTRSQFPRLFNDLRTANGTTISVEPPASTNYYNTRVVAVRAYVLPTSAPLDDQGDDVMQFTIGHGPVSSFFATAEDAIAGVTTDLVHSVPRPTLFAYSSSTCQSLSTSASSGFPIQESAFVRYSPYGSWELRLVGKPGSVLSAATIIRLEFDIDTYTAYGRSAGAIDSRQWPLFAGQTSISIVSPDRHGGTCQLAPQASAREGLVGQQQETATLAALVLKANFSGASVPQPGTPAYKALGDWFRSYVGASAQLSGVTVRDWTDPQVAESTPPPTSSPSRRLQQYSASITASADALVVAWAADAAASSLTQQSPNASATVELLRQAGLQLQSTSVDVLYDLPISLALGPGPGSSPTSGAPPTTGHPAAPTTAPGPGFTGSASPPPPPPGEGTSSPGPITAPPTVLAPGSSNDTSLVAIVAAVLGAAVLALIILALFLWRKSVRQGNQVQPVQASAATRVTPIEAFGLNGPQVSSASAEQRASGDRRAELTGPSQAQEQSGGGGGDDRRSSEGHGAAEVARSRGSSVDLAADPPPPPQQAATDAELDSSSVASSAREPASERAERVSAEDRQPITLPGEPDASGGTGNGGGSPVAEPNAAPAALTASQDLNPDPSSRKPSNERIPPASRASLSMKRQLDSSPGKLATPANTPTAAVVSSVPLKDTPMLENAVTAAAGDESGPGALTARQLSGSTGQHPIAVSTAKEVLRARQLPPVSMPPLSPSVASMDGMPPFSHPKRSHKPTLEPIPGQPHVPAVASSPSY